ncbi:MAG: hypothetical protein IJ529_02520 [Alphaproteobacteria bacterium]|nr:hypothetical protein [Alphaproteobacteria bacterium]MBR1649482.1 hypothetical protein [Alphaproteobacteria bacterium]
MEIKNCFACGGEMINPADERKNEFLPVLQKVLANEDILKPHRYDNRDSSEMLLNFKRHEMQNI